MRVLVAGGAGFLGSHLVERLLRRGHRVTVVDRFITSHPDNLADLRSRRLHIIRCDAARTPIGDYERVYHLASPASPIDYEMHPIATLLANSAGTKRLLDIAGASGGRFLLASTSEVYGDPLVHPQPETYFGNVDPIGPRSCYDEGKRFAEALTVAYVRAASLNARIVRIFNSYGPRMRLGDGRMPATFIGAALAGAPIPIHGDGSQTRSLCYVGDTADGLLRAMEKGRVGEVYNIGTEDELSVLAFARLVRRLCRSKAPLDYTDPRNEDPQRRRPDVRKSRNELGWRARTPLKVGLIRTISWYRSQLGAASTPAR